MDKERQTIINQIFDNWKNEKLLDKNGMIKIPILHFEIYVSLIGLTVVLLSGILLLNPVIIIIGLLLQVVCINYISDRIYFTREGIVRKRLFSKQDITYDEITSISLINRLVIQYGSQEISADTYIHPIQPFNKSDRNISVSVCQVRLFCQKVFPDKFTYSASIPIQQACEAIFATIVQTTHDGKSRKYAIEYLKRYICAEHNEDYIAKQLDKLCQEKISKLIDKCLIAADDMIYSEKKEFLDHLFECAYISDGVDDKELAVLQYVANYFMIKEWDFKAMLYKYECNKAEQEKKKQRKQEKRQDGQKRQENQKKVETYFKDITTTAQNTLGVKADASLEEIKSAYRKLAKKMHPDVLPTNATPKQIEEANENFRVITEAYIFLEEKEKMKK